MVAQPDKRLQTTGPFCDGVAWQVQNIVAYEWERNGESRFKNKSSIFETTAEEKK